MSAASNDIKQTIVGNQRVPNGPADGSDTATTDERPQRSAPTNLMLPSILRRAAANSASSSGVKPSFLPSASAGGEWLA
jgi:hypothetical protein